VSQARRSHAVGEIGLEECTCAKRNAPGWGGFSNSYSSSGCSSVGQPSCRR